MHFAARIGEFAYHAFGHVVEDAREGANIGDHANINFINGDEAIFGAVAHIAGGNEVNTAAITAALHRGEDRNTALLNCGETILQRQDAIMIKIHAISGVILIAYRADVTAKHTDINTS